MGALDTTPGTYKLACLATGFYSRAVNLSLLRSGQPVEPRGGPQGVTVLPNGDGTHQARLTTQVSRADLQDYGCQLAHLAGLERPLVITGVEVDEEPGSPALVAAAAVPLVLLLVVGGCVFMTVRRGLVDCSWLGITKHP
ncbi:hereditary hemochromatosis protein homolog [Engraulis encrasicolus]|uniref:hereditary hemochromatosis protein homolog n=1 Tax=Engraulis encrasicolus TaxID=184585 RepID=UPI002FD74CE7